jgi:hypothetical protein
VPPLSFRMCSPLLLDGLLAGPVELGVAEEDLTTKALAKSDVLAVREEDRVVVLGEPVLKEMLLLDVCGPYHPSLLSRLMAITTTKRVIIPMNANPNQFM